MKPHSRKDTPLSISSFSEVRPMTSRNIMNTSRKDIHANALSARQSIERNPRSLKTSKIIPDSSTPSVSINLMLGTMKVDHKKKNNTSKNSMIQQASQSSPAKDITSRSRKPRVSTLGVARSSLTIQAVIQPSKERSNNNKSISSLKRSNSKKEDKIHSNCVSPTKFDPEIAEPEKVTAIPVFPSNSNELSGQGLKKSASENKLLLQKPESFFDSLKEEKSKISVGSTTKKKGSAQKILRKNTASISQSAKKEASQIKTKNKLNKTHRVQISTLDVGSHIGSMKSLPEDLPIDEGEVSPTLQALTTQENQVEAKTPASLRPTRSMTSLKANQKRVNTPTLQQQLQSQPQLPPQSKSQRITPQASTRKLMSSRSRVDTKGGFYNQINTPSMSTDRLSPRTMFSTHTQSQIQSQREQDKTAMINPLALKTTYFRPIEDTKLTEYIQSIRNTQKQTSRFEYKSTDCLLDNEADQQQKEKPQTIVTSFSTTLQSTPDQVKMTERIALTNQDINIEQRSETLPEQLLTNRVGSAYRSNMKESPTKFNNYSHKSSESSLNYLVQTARERTYKKTDNEQYRERKHEKYYEKQPRDNLIKSARFNSQSDENHMFSNESLTLKGLQRSVVTRGPGDKLSPTSVIIGNTEKEINNFSKLDQLLKNFKDEKVEKAKAKNERDLAKNLEGDGLFTPNLGSDEEPSAMLSNLRKSLAKILIVKNENLL